MKKTSIFITVFIFQTLLATSLFAQAKTAANTLPIPPSTIKIDGELSEWNDSLRYHNEEKQLNYTLANDKDNIYFAIRIINVYQQRRVLLAGITLSFDPKGKKKAAYSVTFPLVQANTNILASSVNAGANQSDALQASLTKLRQIKVTGFPEVESDVMSTNNTYGFKTAIKYDKDGTMIYESAIPLKFFGALKPEAWWFNIKINGLPMPDIDRYEQSGAGKGRAKDRNMHDAVSTKSNDNPLSHPELYKADDLWERYFLN